MRYTLLMLEEDIRDMNLWGGGGTPLKKTGVLIENLVKNF